MPKKLTQEEFIERAKIVHGDKYDYSKVEYINNDTKICVICKKHGEFLIIPNNHLKGQGCPICGREKRTKSKDTFEKEARKIHGDKYDYSKVEYINKQTKVCIICKTCGKEFWQTPSNHLAGRGCRYCFFRNSTKDRDTFIADAIKIHGNRYDYSKVKYVNAKVKVCIICREHGEFWMKPNNHLSDKQGCPHCNSSKGEKAIETFLKDNNIEFIAQYAIKMQEMTIFGINNPRIDFYLPIYNAFIEFNGIQHYEFTPAFHKTEEGFNRQIERDKRVKEYCKRNKIKLIVIKYNQIEEIENILNKKLKMNKD